MPGPRKLSKEDGDLIRASSERGIDLARRYGVSPATICDIRKNRSWGDKPPRPLTAREKAKAAGEVRYFTGKPCAVGHISERLVSDRSCMACALEAARARYPLIREKENERSRVYRNKNREKHLASMAAWRENNRETAREATRRWTAQNPERVRAITSARRARVMSAEGSLSAADVKEITRRQGGKCAYCKRKTKMTIDHIIPLIQGGRHSKENIQMTCARCNSAKGGRHPIEFAQRIGLLL